jgi:hypothetical protein
MWHWSVSEIKNILDMGYPLVVHSAPGPLDSLFRDDGSPFNETTDTTCVGHSRVLIGYDDTLAAPIFIMHDPWSPTADSTGAFVWCTQTYLLSVVWPPDSRFLFLAPWEISIEHPDTIDMNSNVSVKARVTYTCPSLFAGGFPVTDAAVRLVLPSGISFASGDSSLHTLPGITEAGDVDSTEWSLMTGDMALIDSLVFVASGLVSSTSSSYPSGYTDSIGGSLASSFCVADVSPPSVLLSYPNGGEELLGGCDDTIRWIASDNVGVDSITLMLTWDAGLSWETLASGEPNDSSCICPFPNLSSDSCMVLIDAFDSAGNVASDTSDSFFTIIDIGISEDVYVERQGHFRFQVGPNPFREEVLVRYTVAPTGEPILLSIFDSSGRIIKKLDLRASDTRESHAVWDGTDDLGMPVPAGIYFCRLRTRERTESRSLILVR